MAASAARRAAFEALLRVDRDAAYSDEVLHSPRWDRLGPRERALLTELVMGVLRHRGELDHMISGRLRKPLRGVDLEVLASLRLGAYQLRHMRTVPPHAAVSESVELVKAARKASAAGLVNAVLRRLPPRPPPDEGLRLCHPEWLVGRWTEAFGPDACSALLAANLRPPAVYFRIPAPAAPQGVLAALERAGLAAEPTPVAGAYQLTKGSASEARRAAGDAIAMQDLNSQRVAALLQVRPRSRVLDLCAAPGGKSRLLADTAPVVAADRRLRRLRTMRRLGDRGIRLVLLDAERPLPLRARFDRILVDAPCSGTGTLARNPEIKWRLRPADLADLQARQERILRQAAQALEPGGVLLYSTCSLEPEENAQVVRSAIGGRRGWSARRALATVPGRDPGDGFEAWRIESPVA